MTALLLRSNHRRGNAHAALSALTVLMLAACAPGQLRDYATPNQNDGRVITRAEIEQSGALDGWEALRWAATHLNYQYTREGSDVRVTHRGVDSFIIDPQVLLVLDGAQMHGLSILENIPASNIEYIQILPARVGVVKYGTTGGNGVVVVKTGVPPSKGS